MYCRVLFGKRFTLAAYPTGRLREHQVRERLIHDCEIFGKRPPVRTRSRREQSSGTFESLAACCDEPSTRDKSRAAFADVAAVSAGLTRARSGERRD